MIGKTRRGWIGLAAAGLALMACTPAAHTGPSAEADGVGFSYRLAEGSAPGRYQVLLTLKDAKSGKPIPDAAVALKIYGPGIDGDGLVNLKHDVADSAPVYMADVRLPQAASYRLTFQVNRRAPAASAQATFTTNPKAG